MAAPATIDTTNISGVWVMNKTLSDDTADVLTAQSIGWVLRKAIGVATITVTIKHITDAAGVEQLDAIQSLSGMRGTVENRTLDWQERPHEDHVFGKVVGKTKRIQFSEIEDEVLKKGWTEDSKEKGFIQSYVVSEQYNWTAEQIWGFMEINGERRYARRIKLTTPKIRLDKVLVYDYQSA